MIQQILDWLQTLGYPGLFLVMFLEGSSMPFPGMVLVLSYGYILSPGYMSTFLVAAGMSIVYTTASLIPYYLGNKLEDFFPEKFKKGLNKGAKLFKRYGIWSIALTRPFGIGNYISYVAGMSKVSLYKYALLTFVGIYPWSYIMIILGDYFKGNVQVIQQYLGSYHAYGYTITGALLAIVIFAAYKRVSKNRMPMKEGGGRNCNKQDSH